MTEPIILADENIALASVRALREAGYRVVAVAEEASGMADDAVLDRACQLGAILVIFDRDYGALIFRRSHRPCRAVIYLRSVPESPEEITRVVRGLLEGRICGEIDGQMVAWTREGTRKRFFPGRP